MHSPLQNNAADTATFLLQAMDLLPNMEELSAQLMGENDAEEIEEVESKSNGKTIGIGAGIGEVQCLPSPMEDGETNEILISATTPRTKLTLAVHTDGIRLTSPKDERIVLRPDAVKHVIFFPKREDCLKKPKTTKEGGHILIPGSLVLIMLEDEKVSFRNKKLKQICLQLPQHRSNPIDSHGEDSRPTEAQLTNACVDGFEQQLIRLFVSSLGLKEGVYRVYNPKYQNSKESTSYVFQSDDGGMNKSIMQGQMPYLKCYQGVNDGVIFPMEEGLLFYKPPMFVHRSDLHSIAVGRGGGSRYIDLHAAIDGKDGEKNELEFTNIDREEMQVLNSYIHNTLVKAMTKDAEENDSEDAQDDDSVEVDDAKDDSHDKEKSRKRSRRAASVEAQKAARREMKTSAQESSNKNDDESDEEEEDDDYEAREMSDSDDEEAEEDSDEGDVDASEGESDETASEED
jgi:hypothetical protein